MEPLKAISDRRAYRALSPEQLPADMVRRIVIHDVPVLTDGPQTGAPSLARGNSQPLDAMHESLSEGNAWAKRAEAAQAAWRGCV